VTEFSVESGTTVPAQHPALKPLVDRIYAAIAGHTEPEAKEAGTPPGAIWYDAYFAALIGDELLPECWKSHNDGGAHHDGAPLWKAHRYRNGGDLMQTVEMGDDGLRGCGKKAIFISRRRGKLLPKPRF